MIIIGVFSQFSKEPCVNRAVLGFLETGNGILANVLPSTQRRLMGMRNRRRQRFFYPALSHARSLEIRYWASSSRILLECVENLCTVDKLENVVVDEVGASGGIMQKLESLSVVHGALLLVDLFFLG